MKGGTPMQNAKQLDRWIAQIAGGDTAALANLYQETSSSVYAYALSVLKSSHDAEDVLHDCYLSVWTAASSYRSSGKPMAWLLTIAKNLCRKQLRVRNRTETWPEEDWTNSLQTQYRLLLPREYLQPSKYSWFLPSVQKHFSSPTP